MELGDDSEELDEEILANLGGGSNAAAMFFN